MADQQSKPSFIDVNNLNPLNRYHCTQCYEELVLVSYPNGKVTLRHPYSPTCLHSGVEVKLPTERLYV